MIAPQFLFDIIR